jgi:hypothetical protein
MLLVCCYLSLDLIHIVATATLRVRQLFSLHYRTKLMLLGVLIQVVFEADPLLSLLLLSHFDLTIVAYKFILRIDHICDDFLGWGLFPSRYLRATAMTLRGT